MNNSLLLKIFGRVLDFLVINILLQTFFGQVDAYEVKNQELMSENADLKALLRSMQVSNHFITICTSSLLKFLSYKFWNVGHAVK